MKKKFFITIVISNNPLKDCSSIKKYTATIQARTTQTVNSIYLIENPFLGFLRNNY